jgi:hypothetical protein
MAQVKLGIGQICCASSLVSTYNYIWLHAYYQLSYDQVFVASVALHNLFLWENYITSVVESDESIASLIGILMLPSCRTINLCNTFQRRFQWSPTFVGISQTARPKCIEPLSWVFSGREQNRTQTVTSVPFALGHSRCPKLILQGPTLT